MAVSNDLSPPPPYTRVVPPSRPIPEITILLLGSPGVGKTTFLSAIPRVRDGQLKNLTTKNVPANESFAYCPDVPNPSSFDVNLFNRPYRIVIHRSESTLFIDPFPSKIDFVIMCYAVDSRESLYNCQFYWRKQFAERYEKDLGLTVPVMLLGLKRDLRTAEKRIVEGVASVAEVGGKEVGAGLNGNGQISAGAVKDEYVCVMPEEGVKAASEMLCDKYAECSALTGDLMWEALEDITRTAALTTTEKGGLSQASCIAM